MKKLLSLALIFIMFLAIVGCSTQKTEIEKAPIPTQTELKNTPTPTETPDNPSPPPEPKPFVPEDLFATPFNPFGGADFPANFYVYGAAFSIGDDKFDGRPTYTLSLTAEGNTNESIKFLAGLAALTDAEISIVVKGFAKEGFSEFQGTNNSFFRIKRTDRKDDRYPYVEGIFAEIRISPDTDQVPQYLSLVRDNYNENALTAAAEYFNVTPAFDVYEIHVDHYKKSSETVMRYALKNVSDIHKEMTEQVKCNWIDTENNRIGLSYGAIDLTFGFDSKNGTITVSQTTGDIESPLCDYAAPAVSLSTLGFYYEQKDALCIYRGKEKKFSVAIHKPEWGNREDSWNLEFFQEINGYNLVMWYNADNNDILVQTDKGSMIAKYSYSVSSGKNSGEYPDLETVRKQFSVVFDTQDANVLDKPIKLFEQTLQEHFRMRLEELYALPIR